MRILNTGLKSIKQFLMVSFVFGVLPVAVNANEPPVQAPKTNPITQAAVQLGILNCAARINQVANFLGFDNRPDSGALLMAQPVLPDQKILPLVMELPAGENTAYVSVTFAPNQANGCGATYDAVVYWPDNCEIVAKKSFNNLRAEGHLKHNIAILDGGASTKVFLMEAGAGCVSIKKEYVQ